MRSRGQTAAPQVARNIGRVLLPVNRISGQFGAEFSSQQAETRPSHALNQTRRPALGVSRPRMRDMDASPAIVVLLMCSPAGTDCLEIRSERIYESVALCREALPEVLARADKGDRKLSGRCAATETVPPGVDPIVTCSTGRAGHAMTTV